jgi:phenylpropionate dioxygenase-like ring-hydroxylating dioxygenase large terminal subunit
VTAHWKINCSSTIKPFSIPSLLLKGWDKMFGDWPIALANGWHPVAYATEVKEKPFSVTLMGHPLVIFRGANGFGILEDRCPHRNVPLSSGKVSGGVIACPYHGWEFQSDGQCTKVPGAATCPAVSARAFPVVERAGLIWTSLASVPDDFPVLPPEIEDETQDRFWWHLPVSPIRVLDAIENLLDPMHSYFLHPGLVRGKDNWRPMTVEFSANAQGCDARYTEERKGLTWLQRLTEGQRTHSFGRYRAPTIAQIAFEDAKGITATISVIFSPTDENQMRPFTQFSTRKGVAPSWLKRLFIIGFHAPVVAQDRMMLTRQSETIQRFGRPDFAKGPIDFFGPVIWRLVNGQAQADEADQFDLVFE